MASLMERMEDVLNRRAGGEMRIDAIVFSNQAGLLGVTSGVRFERGEEGRTTTSVARGDEKAWWAASGVRFERDEEGRTASGVARRGEKAW